jgi:hypothetical protein
VTARRRGRTVTVTEREVDAFVSAFCLYQAEIEGDFDESGQFGTAEQRRTIAALVRIMTKLREAK